MRLIFENAADEATKSSITRISLWTFPAVTKSTTIIREQRTSPGIITKILIFPANKKIHPDKPYRKACLILPSLPDWSRGILLSKT